MGPHVPIEQMPEIVRRVGGHQQHPAPFGGHGQRGASRDSGLAHTALAPEEQNAFGSCEGQQHET